MLAPLPHTAAVLPDAQGLAGDDDLSEERPPEPWREVLGTGWYPEPERRPVRARELPAAVLDDLSRRQVPSAARNERRVYSQALRYRQRRGKHSCRVPPAASRRPYFEADVPTEVTQAFGQQVAYLNLAEERFVGHPPENGRWYPRCGPIAAITFC